MKPIIWSDKAYAEEGLGWHREGTDI